MATKSFGHGGVSLQAQPPRPMTWTALLAHSRGWIGILVLAPALVGAAMSPVHFPAGSWGQFACDSVGWLLFLAGAAMRWWATLYVGARKNNTLVTEGPYSITRNPLYCGTFLLALAVGVLSQNAVLLAAEVLVGFFYVYVTVSTEERELTATYGDRFRDYCQRVPRFFPKFRRIHVSETVDVHVKGLRCELLRMSRWAWIPILCDLFTHLRSEAWWPLWLQLP
jgi:protein-S-isoprenylcysteine O-methyltransferase Ste14